MPLWMITSSVDEQNFYDYMDDEDEPDIPKAGPSVQHPLGEVKIELKKPTKEQLRDRPLGPRNESLKDLRGSQFGGVRKKVKFQKIRHKKKSKKEKSFDKYGLEGDGHSRWEFRGRSRRGRASGRDRRRHHQLHQDRDGKMYENKDNKYEVNEKKHYSGRRGRARFMGHPIDTMHGPAEPILTLVETRPMGPGGSPSDDDGGGEGGDGPAGPPHPPGGLPGGPGGPPGDPPYFGGNLGELPLPHGNEAQMVLFMTYWEKLRTRARSLLYIKDLARFEDHMSVKRAMIMLISQEKMTPVVMYGTVYNIVDYVPQIYEEAFQRTIEDRSEYARRQLGDRIDSPVKGLIAGIFQQPLLYMPRFNQVDSINQRERMVPYGSQNSFWTMVRRPLTMLAYFMGLAISCTAVALVEEGVKHLLGRLDSTCYEYIPLVKYVPDVSYTLLPKQVPMVGPALVALFESGHTNNMKSFSWRFPLHSLFTILGWRGVLLHSFWNMTMVSVGKRDLRMDLRVRIVEDKCLSDCVVKQTKLSTNFKVKYGQFKCRQSFAAYRHFSIAGFEPIIYRQCSCNEKISLEGRVGKWIRAHDHRNDVRQMWVRAGRMYINEICDKIGVIKMPVPFKEWVLNFKPIRRNLLIKVHDEGYFIRDNPQAQAFIKREFSIRRIGDDFYEEKDPRMIQGCPVELSIYCGPWVRKLASRICCKFAPLAYTPSELRRGCQVIYTCGLTGEQIGQAYCDAIALIESQLDDDDRIVIIEDDQSRFDMHLGVGAFSVLNSVYRRVFNRHVANALKRSKNSKGRTALGTKFKVPYTMQSGWPDTSCADTLCNMILKYYIHRYGAYWVSIINGDDSVTVMSEKHFIFLGGVLGLERAYSEFGMDVNILVRYNPLDTEFCSSRFYPVNDTYVLLPKLGRTLAKIGFDKVQRKWKDHIPWVRGIAKTLKCYGVYDPLYKALADSILEVVGDGRILVELNDYKYVVDGSGSQPTNDNVLSYYSRHYLIDLVGVESLKHLFLEYYDGIDYNHCLLEQIVQIDNNL